MAFLKRLSGWLPPAKRRRAGGPADSCFLCGRALETCPFRYDGKNVCHECFTDLRKGRKQLTDTRAAGNIKQEIKPRFSVGMVRPDDAKIKAGAARWSEGLTEVTGETTRSAVIDYWNSTCPIEQEAETWAIFNRTEGIILRRFRDKPYEVLSSHHFDPDGMISEYTREKKYCACMLEEGRELLPDTPCGSWQWGGRDRFDDVISLSYDGSWISGSAACHYHDGGWGGSGPVHESRSFLYPAALFANRRDVLETAAKRLAMLPYRPEGILAIMEEGGFLSSRTEAEPS